MKINVMKKIGVNIILSVFAIIICLFLLELVLRTGFFDQEDNPHPVWIPHKFEKVHKEINQRNWQIAKLNPYRFTDKVRDFKKGKDITRIAVLGDSFIWGYGIPYEHAWGHKLEKVITEKYQNFEVLKWGFGAWSTIDEISFFEKDGINYDIDMLIVGFVNNDPDMGEIESKNFSWHKFFLVKVLKIFFPNAVSFIRAHLYKFLFNYFKNYGYENWVNNIYSEENLHKYSDLLQDFSRFCNNQKYKIIICSYPLQL